MLISEVIENMKYMLETGGDQEVAYTVLDKQLFEFLTESSLSDSQWKFVVDDFNDKFEYDYRDLEAYLDNVREEDIE